MKPDQLRTFWLLWGGYFAFYLCRLNLAASLSILIRSEGLSPTQAGWIGSGFFACYGLGQILNGHNSDRLGTRRVLALGLLGSAVANIAFACSRSLPLLLFFWSVNGVFQSMGWPSCMRGLANWFPVQRRGKVFGLFATSYHTGTVVALLLAGWLCSRTSWRVAFLVPSVLLLVASALFYTLFRDHPKEVAVEPATEVPARGPAAGDGPWEGEAPAGPLRPPADGSEGASPSRGRCGPPVGARLLSPRLLLVGLAVSAMSVVGYGFLFWTPTYLAQTRHLLSLRASSQSLFLAVAGAASVAFTGWASDTLFHGRRMPLLVGMSAVCAVLVFLFPQVPLHTGGEMAAYLAAVGFFAYGPHGMLVGVVALDLVSKEQAGRAAGILDAFGYAGAVLTGAGTGWLSQHHGWGAVFPAWALSVALCAGLCSLLWRMAPAKGGEGQHMEHGITQ